MIYLFINLVGVQSTGVEEAATYAGLVYYEKKEAEDLVTFTAAKKLSALLEVIFNYGNTTNNSILNNYSLLKMKILLLKGDKMFIFRTILPVHMLN